MSQDHIPPPDDVKGPPLVEYFTREQLDAARSLGISQGKVIAKLAFDRRWLVGVAWERFNRWLRRL